MAASGFAPFSRSFSPQFTPIIHSHEVQHVLFSFALNIWINYRQFISINHINYCQLESVLDDIKPVPVSVHLE